MCVRQAVAFRWHLGGTSCEVTPTVYLPPLYVRIYIYIPVSGQKRKDFETRLTAISHGRPRPVVEHMAGGWAEECVGVCPEVGRELGGCGGGGESWREGRDTLGWIVNLLSVCVGFCLCALMYRENRQRTSLPRKIGLTGPPE